MQFDSEVSVDEVARPICSVQFVQLAWEWKSNLVPYGLPLVERAGVDSICSGDTSSLSWSSESGTLDPNWQNGSRHQVREGDVSFSKAPDRELRASRASSFFRV